MAVLNENLSEGQPPVSEATKETPIPTVTESEKMEPPENIRMYKEIHRLI